VNLDTLRISLTAHEGKRNLPYEDSENTLTIGIGHNLERPISDHAISIILEDDITEAITELDRHAKGWRNHNDARQNVLIEMQFNLGAERLAGFKLMWAALAIKDYKEAAKQMRDSKWARQVKARAETLAIIMETGL
jgi:lysozyme